MSRNRKNCQFQRILIGYDGSEQSERALEAALTIACASDSRVEILSVVRPSEPSKRPQPFATVEHARKNFEQKLQRISEAACGNGIQVTSEIVIGHPAEQILQRAQEIHADLVVVGQHGASKLEEITLGSVSERVMAYAECPVLVTR